MSINKLNYFFKTYEETGKYDLHYSNVRSGATTALITISFGITPFVLGKVHELISLNIPWYWVVVWLALPLMILIVGYFFCIYFQKLTKACEWIQKNLEDEALENMKSADLNFEEIKGFRQRLDQYLKKKKDFNHDLIEFIKTTKKLAQNKQINGLLGFIRTDNKNEKNEEKRQFKNELINFLENLKSTTEYEWKDKKNNWVKTLENYQENNGQDSSGANNGKPKAHVTPFGDAPSIFVAGILILYILIIGSYTYVINKNPDYLNPSNNKAVTAEKVLKRLQRKGLLTKEVVLQVEKELKGENSDP